MTNRKNWNKNKTKRNRGRRRNLLDSQLAARSQLGQLAGEEKAGERMRRKEGGQRDEATADETRPSSCGLSCWVSGQGTNLWPCLPLGFSWRLARWRNAGIGTWGAQRTATVASSVKSSTPNFSSVGFSEIGLDLRPGLEQSPSQALPGQANKA